MPKKLTPEQAEESHRRRAEYRRVYRRAWRATEKGKAASRRYKASARYKAAQATYRSSAKGKIVRDRQKAAFRHRYATDAAFRKAVLDKQRQYRESLPIAVKRARAHSIGVLSSKDKYHTKRRLTRDPLTQAIESGGNGRLAYRHSQRRCDTETTPVERLLHDEQRLILRSAIARLYPTQQTVLTLRLGLDGKEPMWLSRVGKLIHRTTERVRQIEHEALRRLPTLVAMVERGL